MKNKKIEIGNEIKKRCMITLEVTPEFKAKLKKLANKEVRNLTDQIRKILTDALEKNV